MGLTAFGQATSSATGTVTDPSGAVIPNATITFENAATGVTRETKTDAAGIYRMPQMTPGTYRIKGKASGFSDIILNNVTLLVNQPATYNVVFEKVGAVNEVVSVSADASSVNTVDASLGNAIGNKPIMEMPLNARNIVGLLSLQPGVVTTKEGDTDSRNGAVNGGKSDQANVTLDGVDVNDQMDRQAFTSVLRMTPDSVQEFRVTTMNANADSGRSSGAQVVMVTKGGSNELHGSLYEYHRNTVTTANDFFNNATGVEREKLIRNIFGVSLGGPIIKNKLFLFGNWEGRRDAKDGSAVRAVPSMLMRQGVAQYMTKSGNIAQVTGAQMASIFDPRGASQAALKVMQSYPVPNDHTVGDDLNVQGYRFKASTPLRWNTYISRLDYILDPQNKHTLFVRGNLQNDNEQGLPQFPGQPAASVSLTNNKGLAAGLTSVLTPTVISNFRYGLTRQGFERTGASTSPVVTLRGLDEVSAATRGFAAIIPVHTFSEDLNVVKEDHTIQLGVVARRTSNMRTDLQNSFSTASANASWLVNSGNGLIAPFSDLDTSSTTYFKYALTDIMGIVSQGNAKYNYLTDGTVLGQGQPVKRNFRSNEFELYVQDTWKLRPNLTVIGGLRYSLMPPIYEANHQQVSPSIPLDTWFNLRGGLAQNGLPQSQAGVIAYLPYDNGGRELYNNNLKNLAPRLSLAYSPSGADGWKKALFGSAGKTSIRAGWGMYYDLFGSGLMRSYDATAFGLSNALTNPSGSLDINTAPRYTGPTSIPAGLLPAAPEAKFPATYPRGAFAITNSLDENLKAPYNMSMNFSWGREFSGGWFVQGSYIGRLSRRSLARRDVAMPTDLKDPKSGQTYFEAATILAKLVNKDTATSAVPKVPFWENLWSGIATPTLSATQVAYSRFYNNQYDWTTALYQLDTQVANCVGRNRCSNLGPYASFNDQYSYLSTLSSMAGGKYNAGQLSVRKRFNNGDQLDFNYTFSKSQDLRSNTERVGSSTGVIWNPWQPGLMKGVSDYDNTHLFNAMGIYNLPIGKGKKYLTAIPAWADAIIGGWQVSGMWRWSSGFPESVYETSFWPTNWNNNNWAIWNGTPVTTGHYKNVATPSGSSGPNMFADTSKALSAFDFELPGGVGTRNPVRGDGVFNIDTSVAKRFTMPWSEKHTLQFRWETFNLTNTAKFDVYTASLDIAASGTFGAYQDMLTQPRVMQFSLRYQF